MAPDRSCSLRTSFFWPVSHLRPPSASDTPWVALCYSSVTRLAFGPLPPPGTTPVLYPRCYGVDLAPLSGPWWTWPWFSLGLRPLFNRPFLPTLLTPVLPVVFWPAGLHRPSGFLSGSGSGLHTLTFDSDTPYYPHTSPACSVGLVSPVFKLFRP
ncbi:hypothetical protein M404DRAFT_23769 [Pisolithus tinctorius Marx 270]|uniref:Uncharacterized protein n=1 Tax=Pisolithus tinctorius Marx 270 TaxID=870435 RepID=A0A0C3KCC4_PISTI|nr:hypothetical protein M404DRAFT_23769 [Pisolithus tinctorius Marx 270]